MLYQVNLTPVNEKPIFSNGNQVVSFNTNTWNADICYKGKRDSYLEFNVVLTNNSRDTFLVDPVQWYYLTWIKNPDTSIHALKLDSIKGIDPERTIAELENQNAEVLKEQNPYSVTVLDLAVGVIVATSDVSRIFTGDKRTEEQRQEERENKERQEEKENNRINWENDHARKLQDLKSEISYWKNQTLRKNTVFPLKSISGAVNFPISASPNEIELAIKAGNRSRSVQYKQEFLYR
jgi:hypothetical protein